MWVLWVYDDTKPRAPLGGDRGWTRIGCVQSYPKPAALPGPKSPVGWTRFHIASIHEFVSNVVNGRPGCPSFEDGLRVQRVVDLRQDEIDMLPEMARTLDPNDLLTLASKTTSRLDRKYDNGWEVIISAPSKEWLCFEAEVIAPGRSEALAKPLLWDRRQVNIMQLSNASSPPARRSPVDWLTISLSPPLLPRPS